MRIAIIGAGNAGSACEFMAAEVGHKVRLLKTSNHITHDEHFERMVENKGIYCIDNTKTGRFTDSSDNVEKTFQPLEMIARNPKEVFESYKVSSPPGPYSLDNRDVTEDVPMGLVLLSSLGEKLGINTPECNRLIEMCGGLLARDFFKEGRTLTSLGLSELSKEELLSFVEEESATVNQKPVGFT